MQPRDASLAPPRSRRATLTPSSSPPRSRAALSASRPDRLETTTTIARLILHRVHCRRLVHAGRQRSPAERRTGVHDHAHERQRSPLSGPRAIPWSFIRVPVDYSPFTYRQPVPSHSHVAEALNLAPHAHAYSKWPRATAPPAIATSRVLFTFAPYTGVRRGSDTSGFPTFHIWTTARALPNGPGQIVGISHWFLTDAVVLPDGNQYDLATMRRDRPRDVERHRAVSPLQAANRDRLDLQRRFARRTEAGPASRASPTRRLRWLSGIVVTSCVASASRAWRH